MSRAIHERTTWLVKIPTTMEPVRRIDSINAARQWRSEEICANALTFWGLWNFLPHYGIGIASIPPTGLGSRKCFCKVNLGILYNKGKGVEKDFEKARECFQLLFLSKKRLLWFRKVISASTCYVIMTMRMNRQKIGCFVAANRHSMAKARWRILASSCSNEFRRRTTGTCIY